MTSESSRPGRSPAAPAATTPAVPPHPGSAAAAAATTGAGATAAPPARGAAAPASKGFRRRFRLRRRDPEGAGPAGHDGAAYGVGGFARPGINDDPFPDDVLAEPAPGQPVAGPRPRSRGFYLLPNAFTTGCLFAGFYAVVMAMHGEFETASIAIFVAMVLDTLDGRVARLTRTQSAFGEQYDSLADMVSFGLAPALIMYTWALMSMGKLGWIGAFIYCAGAALRLARFNTNIGSVDKRFFQGLPSPAAAALVVGLVWVATDLRENEWITATGRDLRWLAWVVTVYAGVTMVSNVPFYSFKDVNLRRAVPFIFVLLLVAGFVLISSDPPTMLFTLFVIYGLSGYAMWVWRYWNGKPGPTPQRPPAAAGTSVGTASTQSGTRESPEGIAVALPDGSPSEKGAESPASQGRDKPN